MGFFKNIFSKTLTYKFYNTFATLFQYIKDYNIRESLGMKIGEKIANLRTVAGMSQEQLAEILGLVKPVRRIEAYDISNISGASNVAGMVVFQNGKPYKAGYRKFKIKSTLS